MKKTIVFDFDGVIHSYTSGWKGITNIPDKPVNGIKEAIDELRSIGYEVVIVSTRCETVDGMQAIKDYLENYSINVDKIQSTKPPALVYVDDRALCFNGKTENLVKNICNFKAWWEHDNKK